MLKPTVAAALALVSLLIPTRLVHAQAATATTPGFELIVPSGTVVPTGGQDDGVKNDVKRGNLTAVQVSFGVRPDLVLTSTVGWARTSLSRSPETRLDLFTYDAGVEYRLPRRRGDRRINFKPFTGAGLGARTHSYRDGAIPATHNLATYASVGGELGLSRVRVRLEVRDYLTWASALQSSRRTRRNDVAVLAGLRLALR